MNEYNVILEWRRGEVEIRKIQSARSLTFDDIINYFIDNEKFFDEEDDSITLVESVETTIID